MSRPETFEDLSADQLRGHVLVTVADPEVLLRYPDIGHHLVAAYAAAAARPEVIVESGQILAVLTDKDLEERIVQAQQSWDRKRDQYEEALTSPEKILGWQRGYLNEWAAGNDRELIDWTGVVAAGS